MQKEIASQTLVAENFFLFSSYALHSILRTNIITVKSARGVRSTSGVRSVRFVRILTNIIRIGFLVRIVGILRTGRIVRIVRFVRNVKIGFLEELLEL